MPSMRRIGNQLLHILYITADTTFNVGSSLCILLVFSPIFLSRNYVYLYVFSSILWLRFQYFAQKLATLTFKPGACQPQTGVDLVS